ncbi:MAG: hypothetical protein F6K00_31610 [Leptolyngbya sp. SIOISBB]|nr:hypothetical protein [Leptolyngbya sp. SIOISBB]
MAVSGEAGTVGDRSVIETEESFMVLGCCLRLPDFKYREYLDVILSLKLADLYQQFAQ